MPVTAILSAVTEIRGCPDNIVHITDRCDNLVNKPLVLEEDHLYFAIRIVVLIPLAGFLVVFEQTAAPHSEVDLRGVGCTLSTQISFMGVLRMGVLRSRYRFARRRCG